MLFYFFISFVNEEVIDILVSGVQHDLLCVYIVKRLVNIHHRT